MNKEQEIRNRLILRILPYIDKIKVYGVDHLGYRYFLPDGSSFGFTTNDLWYTIKKTERFFEDQKNHFESEILFLTKNRINIVTRSLNQDENNYLRELDLRSMSNSVGIYRFSKQKIEHFFFISLSKENSSKDLMLNYKDLLNQYVDKLSIEIEKSFDELAEAPSPEFYLSKSLLKQLFIQEKNYSLLKNRISFNGCASNLTKRELEILSILRYDFSNRIIAERLQISIRTVESFIEKLKIKFNCNRRKLIALARDIQLECLFKYDRARNE